jgi:hypothetical protein
VGFSVIEAIRTKQEFEQFSISVGVYIESNLTNSGAFKANAFVQQIKNYNQRIHYCGANAHHKNGVAKRAVWSISNMACALLLHTTCHWKNGIDSSLWPMTVMPFICLITYQMNSSCARPTNLRGLRYQDIDLL